MSKYNIMSNWYKIAQETMTDITPNIPLSQIGTEVNNAAESLLQQLKSQHPDLDQLLMRNPGIENNLMRNPQIMQQMIENPDKVREAIGIIKYHNVINQPFSFKELLGKVGIDLVFGAANWLLDIL